METREFLGTEPIKKLILRLSIPTVAAQLINLLYNLVDRIYIGHIAEDGALILTGVGVCMPVILVVSAFAGLVGSGGAPRASILLGRKEHDQAEEILGECAAALVILAVILTAVLLLFSRPLLLLFGASANTIGYALSYMNIYAAGTIFVQLTLGLNMFITAQGFVRESMFSVLIGAVLNIVLDPILIFAFHMNAAGAALATIISQAVSCFYVLKFLTGRKTALRLRKKNLHLRPGVILPCLALGSAAFIMQATESVIQVCFNSSLLKYGGDLAVGSMTILSSVLQFVMLPVHGFSQGAQPILSYNYGAGNTGRVKEAFWFLLKISLGYTVCFCGLVLLFPRVPIALFTTSGQLLDYAAAKLRIYILGMTIFGIQITIQCIFTSLGKAASAIMVASMRKLILLVPFIYLFPAILPGLLSVDQATAVFMAEPAADVLSVLFACFMFAFTFRSGVGVPLKK